MDKRLIVFFLISAGIMIGYNVLFGLPKTPPVNPPPQPQPVGPGFWTSTTDAVDRLFRDSRPRPAARDNIVLESQHLRATFTNVGAGIRTLILRDFPGPGKEVPLLVTPEGQGPNFAMADLDGHSGLSSEPWEVDTSTPGSITFETTTRAGLHIRKRFTMNPTLHLIEMEVHLSNPTGRIITANMDWNVIRRVPNDGTYRADQYLMGLYGTPAINVVAFPSTTKAPVKVTEKNREWFGMRNRFFVVAILARDSEHLESELRYSMIPGMNNPENPGMSLTLPVSVSVERERTWKYTIFGGPIEAKVLEEAGPRRLTPLATIGGGCFLFTWIVPVIADILLWLMAMMYKLVGNYGVAIILTTLVVRLCLFPLSRKSQIAMAKYGEMQKALKPRMDAIRTKYADDPEKQRQAQMELFREHGMSLFPVAGCLPILLQLPVFIGMYSVFDQSIDLRGQQFMLWIDNLSESDHLVRLSSPINLWLFTFDGWLNVLPILMTITWFLQAYFQPRSPDPQMAQQQKIMMFMPVFFGVMCYSLASGLSLYFLVNSLLGMAEQRLIKKLWLPPAESPPAAAS